MLLIIKSQIIASPLFHEPTSRSSSHGDSIYK